jgi:uncharacterized protein (TIGR02598 family)
MKSSSYRRRLAFSLVEAALSLGIISFAVVAIMGLFPVAMQTAQENDRETRAALIARRIFDELQSLPVTNTALVKGPSMTDAECRIRGINLASPSVHVLMYDKQGEGLTNTVAPETFQHSISAPAAYFAAEVRVTPNFPSPGIARVQANVEAPSSAPSSRRSKFVFVTLMNQE